MNWLVHSLAIRLTALLAAGAFALVPADLLAGCGCEVCACAMADPGAGGCCCTNKAVKTGGCCEPGVARLPTCDQELANQIPGGCSCQKATPSQQPVTRVASEESQPESAIATFAVAYPAIPADAPAASASAWDQRLSPVPARILFCVWRN
jgi:hypothetical protein